MKNKCLLSPWEAAAVWDNSRRRVKKWLALIEEQATDVGWIEYPDRLVRFGGSILEQAFRWKGVRLEVLEPPKQSEPTEA
jgi:predicted site-specific integrase-resolvase